MEPKDAGELVPKGFTRTEWGFHQAIKRAGQNTSIKEFLLEGTKNVFGYVVRSLFQLLWLLEL